MDDNHDARITEMEKDKADREKESLQDLMQFERAGLSEEEKAKIPKLCSENNDSYAYLRSKSNPWEYDPEEPHPKLKNRLYRRFDTFDKDSDGEMILDEVLCWADRIKTLCKSTDDEIEAIRDALGIVFKAVGVTKEGGLRRENWIEANQCFAEAERERRKHGEPLLAVFLANTYYDVLDEDGDNLVSLPELKKMMNVFQVPEEAAYTFFAKADVDNSGMLEREEMHALFHRFWLEKYDPDLDGIYAYKY